MPSPIWAGQPVQLEHVAQGQAQITQDLQHTTIEVSDQAVLEYSRFDIPVDHTVQFVQPAETSRVLNRVMSSDPSRIEGNLLANGQVYLFNPAGVIFGDSAVVDVARFYTGAAHITDTDFMNRLDYFNTTTASVINQGTIDAPGGAHLIGYYVENVGTILADAGLVTLTSGDEVLLSVDGSSIHVQVDSMDAATGQGGESAGVTQELGVLNEGKVSGSEVLFASGDVYSLALVNRGEVESPGGSIAMTGQGLVINEGTLDASDATTGGVGGTVTMLGEHVGVVGGKVLADGQNDGGRIYVGGDFQGGGEMRTAAGVFVDNNSQISADAISDGDGGRVIVWADDATRVYTPVSARGGANGGHGGFVETSGKQFLDVTQAADVSAPIGDGGTWLLDPSNVTIQNGFGCLDLLITNPLFVATTNNSTISAGVIETALDNGSSVTISTNRLLGGQDGDITLNSDVALTKSAGGNAVLTLQAANDIILDGTITSTSANLGLVLTANDLLQVVHDGNILAGDVLINGAINTNGGGILSTGRDFNNTAAINTGGGSLNISHTGDIAFDAAINTAGGALVAQATGLGRTIDLNSSIATGAGAVSIDTLGTVNLDAASSITTTSGFVNIGSILAGVVNLGGSLISTTGDMVFDSALTLANDFTIDTSLGGGDVTLNATIDGAALLTINAGMGDISIQDALGGTTPLAGINLIAAGIEVDADILTTGGQDYTGDLTLAAVTLDSATFGDISIDGDVTLVGDASIDTAGGSGDDIIVTGNIEGNQALTLDAGNAGDIDIDGTLGVVTPLADVAITNAADVDIAGNISAETFTQTSGTGDTTLVGHLDTSGGLDADGGAVSIATAGDITVSGTIDTTGGLATPTNAGNDGGDVAIESSAGSITVNQIDTSGSDAAVASLEDGGDAGDIDLQSDSGLSLGGAGAADLRPDGQVVLNGDVIAQAGDGDLTGIDGIGGDVTINLDGRTSVPSVATVTGNPAGGDISIDATGDITVGANEKIASVGDIELTSDNNTITVGDLSAEGAIALDAGASGNINIATRNPGGVLQLDNSLEPDAGVDWVSNNSINTTGTINITGGGADPTVSTLSLPVIGTDLSGNASIDTTTLSAAINLNGSVLLDAIAGVGSGSGGGSGSGSGAGSGADDGSASSGVLPQSLSQLLNISSLQFLSQSGNSLALANSSDSRIDSGVANTVYDTLAETNIQFDPAQPDGVASQATVEVETEE